MGEIIYNGRSCREFGLEVETFPSYTVPQRTVEKIHIPGRNGDLIVDGGCWENGTRSYIVAMGSFERAYFEMANKTAEWLTSATTYARLEDSYEPEIYRLALYSNAIELSNLYNKGFDATIEFDCKPQRFLKMGEEPLTFEGPGELQNPTTFSSRPLIKVFGNGAGNVIVGKYNIAISEIGTEIDIDSETMDAYFGGTNKNLMVTLSGGFPILPPGFVPVSFSGGVKKVEVTPHWFTL